MVGTPGLVNVPGRDSAQGQGHRTRGRRRGLANGWYPTCGTSEATKLFAGVVALADQVAGRRRLGGQLWHDDEEDAGPWGRRAS